MYFFVIDILSKGVLTEYRKTYTNIFVHFLIRKYTPRENGLLNEIAELIYPMKNIEFILLSCTCLY